MKKILLLMLLVVPFLTFAETEEIVVYGEIYEVTVPENYDDLKTAYLRAITAYQEESVDLEELQKEFDLYQDDTDELLDAKDSLIDKQKELIIVKDRRIATLEKQLHPTISFIPNVHYSYSADGSGVGLGVGILLFDSFFLEVQGGYPWEIRASVGWRF